LREEIDDWSAAQENLLLVTGHTHQPVFNSLTHLERLYQQLEKARTLNDADALKKIEAEIPRRKREYDFVNQSFNNMKPAYFNSGCCCFEDGTITGIEISDGLIRLIKWSLVNGKPERSVAEEETLQSLIRPATVPVISLPTMVAVMRALVAMVDQEVQAAAVGLAGMAA